MYSIVIIIDIDIDIGTYVGKGYTSQERSVHLSSVSYIFRQVREKEWNGMEWNGMEWNECCCC